MSDNDSIYIKLILKYRELFIEDFYVKKIFSKQVLESEIPVPFADEKDMKEQLKIKFRNSNTLLIPMKKEDYWNK